MVYLWSACGLLVAYLWFPRGPQVPGANNEKSDGGGVDDEDGG